MVGDIGSPLRTEETDQAEETAAEGSLRRIAEAARRRVAASRAYDRAKLALKVARDDYLDARNHEEMVTDSEVAELPLFAPKPAGPGGEV